MYLTASTQSVSNSLRREWRHLREETVQLQLRGEGAEGEGLPRARHRTDSHLSTGVVKEICARSRSLSFSLSLSLFLSLSLSLSLSPSLSGHTLSICHTH